MKLVLQIAAGIVLGWLVVTGIKLLAGGAALHSLASALQTKPSAPVSPGSGAFVRGNSSADTESAAAAGPEAARADEQHAGEAGWSITTTDGRRFEGQGAPPPGGLPPR